MIYSKPFSTFVDKFVKPTNHERGLWAISVVFFFFFFKENESIMAGSNGKWMRLSNKSETELPQLILSEGNKQAEA